MAFIVTTTGTEGGAQPVFPISGFVPFNGIGRIPGLEHPTTLDLEIEYTHDQIQEDQDIWDAIDFGWITVVDENGNTITDPGDISAGGSHTLDVHSNVDFTGKVEGESNTGISGYEVGSSIAWNGTEWMAMKTSYRHKQNSAATTWNVVHNLGRTPSGVTIVDSGGTTVEGCITIVDLNNLTLEFTAAFGGSAYIS